MLLISCAGSGGLLTRLFALLSASRISSSLKPRRRIVPPSSSMVLLRDPSLTMRLSSMMVRSWLRRVSM